MARQKNDGRGRMGGKPKGFKHPETLAKEAARELVRQAVTQSLEPLIKAHVAKALGSSFLVVRNKLTGKFVRVGKHRAERIKVDEEIVEVWDKDPDVSALKELLDRALDKSADQPAAVKHEGVVTLRWGGSGDAEE